MVVEGWIGEPDLEGISSCSSAQLRALAVELGLQTCRHLVCGTGGAGALVMLEPGLAPRFECGLYASMFDAALDRLLDEGGEGLSICQHAFGVAQVFRYVDGRKHGSLMR